MKTNGISARHGKTVQWRIGILLLLLFSGRIASGAMERAELALLRSPLERLPAETKSKELFFQLPEHVSLEAGTELKLVLEASPELPADLFTVSISFNGTALLTRPAARVSAGGPAAERIELKAVVPEQAARPGWNRVEIDFAHAETLPASAKGNWLLHKSDCRLSLAYSRLPMFSELGRFPASFGEEKLLRTSQGDTTASFVTLILPRVLRDVHLQSCALLGARLGQLGYFTDADYDLTLAEASSWKPGRGNWIFVGTWNEVGNAAVVTNCARLSRPLEPGAGLIAEAIVGSGDDQHRCLVVSGADDAGLVKALLTLGNAKALATIGPSPMIVNETPLLPTAWPGRRGITPAKIAGLNQASRLLVPDESLQALALIAPLNASPAELRMLTDLAFFAGRSLPDSPALAPNAFGYDETHPVSQSRLRGKSVLLLGSAKQWRRALPTEEALAVLVPDPVETRVRMQGRGYPIGQFEPSLTFLQMANTSDADQMLVAGGWESFDSPKLKWMLTDPEAPAKIFGDVAAIDSRGRIVCYDTRRAAADSLAQRLARYIPREASVEETERLVREYEAEENRSQRLNWMVFYVFGGILIFFVGARLLLLWDRARTRERAMHNEKPLPAQ